MVGMKDPWHIQGHLQQRELVEMVLSAYRSLVGDVAYVSMPITTGKRCYDVLRTHGVKSQEELLAKDKQLLYEEIIRPNIEEGCKTAERIRSMTILPLVAPAIFEAKKQRWSQQEYMYLWLSVMEEKVRELYVLDGWQYSHGGMQELVRAMEMEFGWVGPRNSYAKLDDATHLRTRSIRAFDEQGKQVKLDDAAVLLSSAIIDLHIDGFETKTLRTGLQTLSDIAGFLNDYMTTRDEYEWHKSHEHSPLMVECAKLVASDIAAGKHIGSVELVRKEKFMRRMGELAPSVHEKFTAYLKHQRVSQQPNFRLYPLIPQMHCMSYGLIPSS